jgi:hypothetical protein
MGTNNLIERVWRVKGVHKNLCGDTCSNFGFLAVNSQGEPF